MTTLTEARMIAASLTPGAPVVVTLDGRDIECTVQRRGSGDGGGFGHPDSARITVGYGLGRWNMEVTAAGIAAGNYAVRPVIPDARPAYADLDTHWFRCRTCGARSLDSDTHALAGRGPVTAAHVPHDDFCPGVAFPDKYVQRITQV